MESQGKSGLWAGLPRMRPSHTSLKREAMRHVGVDSARTHASARLLDTDVPTFHRNRCAWPRCGPANQVSDHCAGVRARACARPSARARAPLFLCGAGAAACTARLHPTGLSTRLLTRASCVGVMHALTSCTTMSEGFLQVSRRGTSRHVHGSF